MKTRLCLICILTLFIHQILHSQNEYFENNPKWGISQPCQFGPNEPEWGKKTTHYINGDTTLNDEVFVKIFQEGFTYYGTGTVSYTETPYSNPMALAYLRSEDMKMYMWNEELNVKELLYEFDVEVGQPFVVHPSIFPNPLVVVSIGSITLGGTERKVVTVSDGSGGPCSFDYIEGVGHFRGIWYPNEQQLDCQSYLTCFSFNGESYFVNADENPWLIPSTENCEFIVGIVESATPVVEVYPNPTNDELNIQCESSIRSIEISDLMGRVVFTVQLNDTFAKLNIESLTTSLYLLSVTTETGIIETLKFQKD